MIAGFLHCFLTLIYAVIVIEEIKICLAKEKSVLEHLETKLRAKLD